MSITQAFRRIACRQVVHGLVGQTGHLHVQQRHVDMLTTAVVIPMRKRSQDRDSRVQPGQDIRQRHANLHRPRTFFAFRSPREAHETAQPLDHEVITRTLGVRTGLAKPGDRAIDQVRIDRLHRFIVQAIGRQTTNLEVFDQDVRLRRQLTHQLLPFGASEVDGDRLLVAVGRQVIGSLAGVFPISVFKERWPPGARVITVTGALDLDHFSAEVGQDLPGPRPGQHPR
ncbi:hypothetical protein D3C78_639380 [compost metagenome]